MNTVTMDDIKDIDMYISEEEFNKLDLKHKIIRTFIQRVIRSNILNSADPDNKLEDICSNFEHKHGYKNISFEWIQKNQLSEQGFDISMFTKYNNVEYLYQIDLLNQLTFILLD